MSCHVLCSAQGCTALAVCIALHASMRLNCVIRQMWCCAFAGRVLWWTPLPAIPLLEPEQAPEQSSTGPAILAPALEAPLLPADQQKVWILPLMWRGYMTGLT